MILIRHLAGGACSVAVVLCALAGSDARGADWPQWRYDANHSAASPAELPDELHLQWTRTLHAPRPAFPHDPRLCADVSYEPVVAGGRIFVPSMVADCVEAYDVASGDLLWRFFAEGPVRFAPVAWEGRVYFVSDDGFLYCVSAEAGELLWKLRGIPPGRGDYRILGNERLISRWPARGAPVLREGKIYFGCGIWPSEGVYVVAVDARSGARFWASKELAEVKDGIVDHNKRFDIGLPPLGYLAIVGARLAVPCGRAVPALLDPKTGKMEPYTTGSSKESTCPKGNWYVTGIGDYYFHAGYMMATNSAVLRRLPPNASQRGNTMAIGRPVGNEEAFIKAHPQLAIDPADNAKDVGVFQDWVLTESAAYFSAFDNPGHVRRQRAEPQAKHYQYDRIVCKDLSQPRWSGMAAAPSAAKDDDEPSAAKSPQGKESKKKRKGSEPGSGRRQDLDFATRWELPSPLKVHIASGRHLYAGGRNTVAAIALPTAASQQPRVCWQAKIEGVPWRMLAAAERLFVVTEEGTVYCFGRPQVEPKAHGFDTPPAAGHDQWTAAVAKIVERRSDQGGCCLALGWGTGRLIDEVIRQTAMQVIVLEPDEGIAAAARQQEARIGRYGSRVHILQGDLASWELAPYFAELVVSEGLEKFAILSRPAFAAQTLNLLHPYSGQLYLPLGRAEREAISQCVAKAAGEFAMNDDGGTICAERLAAPEGADQ